MCHYINCFHQGPHWLYMDFQEKEQNVGYLEYVVGLAESHKSEDWWWKLELAMHTYMSLEHQRLIRKEPNMKLGECYPYSVLGIDEQVEQMKEKQRCLMERLSQAMSR